jgi:hypothetical protein
VSTSFKLAADEGDEHTGEGPPGGVAALAVSVALLHFRERLARAEALE